MRGVTCRNLVVWGLEVTSVYSMDLYIAAGFLLCVGVRPYAKGKGLGWERAVASFVVADIQLLSSQTPNHVLGLKTYCPPTCTTTCEIKLLGSGTSNFHSILLSCRCFNVT